MVIAFKLPLADKCHSQTIEKVSSFLARIMRTADGEEQQAMLGISGLNGQCDFLVTVDSYIYRRPVACKVLQLHPITSHEHANSLTPPVTSHYHAVTNSERELLIGISLQIDSGFHC